GLGGLAAGPRGPLPPRPPRRGSRRQADRRRRRRRGHRRRRRGGRGRRLARRRLRGLRRGGRGVSITAEARSNIALVKYWGKRDAALNLPAAGSLSLTLDGLVTTTRVPLDRDLPASQPVLAPVPPSPHPPPP